MTEQDDVSKFSRKRSLNNSCSHEEEQQPRTKRSRTSFTTHQFARLMTYFRQDSYPDQMKQQNIAEELDLTRLVVYNWFQNRRAKERKQAANLSSPSYTGFYIHGVPAAQSNLTPPSAMAAATNPSTVQTKSSCMLQQAASQPYQRVAASTPSIVPSAPLNATIPSILKPIQPFASYSKSTHQQQGHGLLPSVDELLSQPNHIPRASSCSMKPTTSTGISHNPAVVAPSTIQYSPSPDSSPFPITPPCCTHSPIADGSYYCDPYPANDAGAIITSSGFHNGEESTSEGSSFLQHYPHVQLPPFSMLFPPGPRHSDK